MKKLFTYLCILFAVGFFEARAQSTGANLISNPSFDTDLTGWGNYFDYFWDPGNVLAAKGDVSVLIKAGYTGKALKVNITNAGSAAYSVQVSTAMPLVAGKKYSMKFKASADAPRKMVINLQQNVDAKTDWYTSPEINLTTTPTVLGPYYYTATTTDASNLFKFYLGGGGATNGISAYFDDVEVAEVISGGQTKPDAPSIGTATAGNTKATITFTAPASDGGNAIINYTVTSNPGSITATGSASPITVTGLTNGTSYTFTVTATNGVGTSNPSAASNAITPNFIPTSYFVSPGGNDNNAGTSTALAWKTLTKANATMIAGDTVFLMTGNYAPFTITNSGTQNGTITYKAYPGDKPVITCGLTGAWNLLQINASYVTIDGIEVKGINQSLTLAQGEKNYNDILTIKSTGASPTQAEWDNTTNTNTNGISIGSGSLSAFHHITVKNCKVHDCSAGGIGATNVDYLTLENNEIYNNSWYTMWATSGISVIHLKALDANGITIFRGNKVYNNYTSVKWIDKKDYSDGNGIIIDVNTGYTGKFLVENNVVFDNGGRGLYIMTAQNATFRNNTSYWNSKKTFSSGGEMVVYDSHDVTFVNNIGWANPAYSPENFAICDNGAWGNNSNIVWLNNLAYNGTVGQSSTYFNKTTTTAVNNTNKLGVNPLFVSPGITATSDFHLQNGSPAINSGTSTNGLSTFDKDYAPRVQGGSVDMGAYESTFTTSIKKNHLPKNHKIEVYPNPTKGKIELVNSNSLVIKQIEVYSIRGELVQVIKDVMPDQNTIYLESLHSGIYILKIITPDQTYFKRVVKE